MSANKEELVSMGELQRLLDAHLEAKRKARPNGDGDGRELRCADAGATQRLRCTGGGGLEWRPLLVGQT